MTTIQKMAKDLDKGDRVLISDWCWIVESVGPVPNILKRPGSWVMIQLIPDDASEDWDRDYGKFTWPGDIEFNVNIEDEVWVEAMRIEMTREGSIRITVDSSRAESSFSSPAASKFMSTLQDFIRTAQDKGHRVDLSGRM